MSISDHIISSCVLRIKMNNRCLKLLNFRVTCHAGIDNSYIYICVYVCVGVCMYPFIEFLKAPLLLIASGRSMIKSFNPKDHVYVCPVLWL